MCCLTGWLAPYLDSSLLPLLSCFPLPTSYVVSINSLLFSHSTQISEHFNQEACTGEHSTTTLPHPPSHLPYLPHIPSPPSSFPTCSQAPSKKRGHPSSTVPLPPSLMPGPSAATFSSFRTPLFSKSQPNGKGKRKRTMGGGYKRHF